MTYLQLGVVFLAVAAVPTVLLALLRRAPGRGRRRLPAGWWAVTGVLTIALVVLTLVFDNLMIAVDLYRYAEDASVLLLGGAPVEDLAWPLAAVLLLPALWALLPDTRAGGSRAGGPTVEPVGRGRGEGRRRPSPGEHAGEPGERR